jgi:hypothetical protein
MINSNYARSTRVDNRHLVAEKGPDFHFQQLRNRQKLLKVGRSKIHKLGVFAVEHMKIDDMIVIYFGLKLRIQLLISSNHAIYVMVLEVFSCFDLMKNGSLMVRSMGVLLGLLTMGEKWIVFYARREIHPGMYLTSKKNQTKRSFRRGNYLRLQI